MPLEELLPLGYGHSLIASPVGETGQVIRRLDDCSHEIRSIVTIAIVEMEFTLNQPHKIQTSQYI